MNTTVTERFDRTNAIIATLVAVLAFVIYWLTKAPTVSFWDCGEFVAASYILGIPHPPGTPLFILFGRIFSIIPFGDNVAANVNTLSALSSALSAMFAYLVTVRLLRALLPETEAIYSKIILYGGGIAGGLLAGFSLTNWNNAVEAEVYGLMMLCLMATVWLLLVYFEKRGTVPGDRLMLLIVYLAFLGIGIHLTTLLIVPVATLFFVIRKGAPSKIWYTLLAFVTFELYLVFALSVGTSPTPYWLPVLLAFVAYLFYLFSIARPSRPALIVAALFLGGILPMIFDAVNLATLRADGTGAISRGTMETVSAIGIIFYAALIAYGAFLAYKTFVKDKGSADSSTKVVIAFVFASLIMIGTLFLVKGLEAFLFITALLILGMGIVVRRYLRWELLLALGAVAMVVVGIKLFFYASIGVALFLLLYGLARRQSDWRQAILIILVAVVGFSSHLFIPIRSAQQPRINENNPSSGLNATINFLERKQYGSQSMVDRMFIRRAEWKNQFGDFQRMGYWKFFKGQYGVAPKEFIFLFLVGVFGLWEIVRRRPKEGASFLLLFLFSSVGLILYMNFSDGTQEAHLEVRDRDYFYTVAYFLFGIAISMGLIAVISTIRDATRKYSSLPKAVIAASMLILLFIPAITIAKNYYYCNRSQNYMAYDYGWNLLSSADENAVLFTFGDNDTFPLWCLQEAFGIRTDVKVVNLTLGNAAWYIQQMNSVQGLDLGMTGDQIEQLRPYRTRDGKVFRLQDQLIDAIVKQNFGKMPINWSVTVPSGGRKLFGYRIDNSVSLIGLSWRLRQDDDGLQVDIDRCYDYFTTTFRWQSLADTSYYKDETARRLGTNYGLSLLMLAEELDRRKDFARAEEMTAMSMRWVPQLESAYQTMASIYSRQGRLDDLRKLVDTATAGDPDWMNFYLAKAEIDVGDKEFGAESLNTILMGSPTFKPALDELIQYYFQTEDVPAMRELLRRWVRFNPNDDKAQAMLNDLEQRLKEYEARQQKQ